MRFFTSPSPSQYAVIDPVPNSVVLAYAEKIIAKSKYENSEQIKAISIELINKQCRQRLIENQRRGTVSSSRYKVNYNLHVRKLFKQIGREISKMLAKANKVQTWDEAGEIAVQMACYLFQDIYTPDNRKAIDQFASVGLGYFGRSDVCHRTLLSSTDTNMTPFTLSERLHQTCEWPEDSGFYKVQRCLYALARDHVRMQDVSWEAIPYISSTDLQDNNGKDYYMHAVHVSENNKMLLAYSQSWEKKVRDIQTVIKPGRYFAKFMDENIANTLAQKHNGYFGDSKLLFIENDDPDGWEQVYRDGPSSCMSDDDAWKVRPYAYPDNDLRLSYITDTNEPSGRITGRAIVRTSPEKHGYIRIYGDEERMIKALEAAGFTRQTVMDGVKIAKIDHEHECGYTYPYIDVGNGGTQRAMKCYDYILITSDGELLCNNTDGTADHDEDEDNYWVCSHCDDRYDAEDESPTYVSGHGDICGYCLDNDFTHYRAPNSVHGRWFHNDDCTDVVADRYDDIKVPDHLLNERSDIVELVEDYNGCAYALKDVCEETFDGYVCRYDEDLVYLARPYMDCTQAHKAYCTKHDGEWYHECDIDDYLTELEEAAEAETQTTTEE